MRIAILVLVLAAACGEKKQEPAATAPQKTTTTTPAAPASPPINAARPDAEFAVWPATLEDRPLDLEWHSMKTTLTARVPVGWVGNGGSFTIPAPSPRPGQPKVSYAFGNRSCSGECDDEDIQKNMAEMWAGYVEGLATPNRNTGDPKLDAMRLDVKVLEEGELPDGKYMAVRVTRPAGLAAPSFLDRLTATCARHRKGDAFYVLMTVSAGLELESTLWPLLLEACKTPWYR